MNEVICLYLFSTTPAILMKKLFLLLSFTLILTETVTQAQNTQIDSLTLLIESGSNDSIQVGRLNQLANLWFQYKTTNSLIHAHEALRISRSIRYLNGEMESLFILSKVLDNLGKLDSAILTSEQALDIAETLSDSLNIAESYILLGGYQSKNGNDNLASEFLFKALEIGERNQFYQICVNSSSALATLNMGLGQMDDAVEYLQQALSYAERIPDINLIAKICINLGIACDSFEMARHYVNRAIRIATENELNRELTYAYNAKGMVFYYYTNDIDSSTYYTRLALNRAKKTGEESLIHMLTKSLADSYAHTNLDSAELYYNRILNDFDIQTYAHVRDRTLRQLAGIKNQKRQFQEAYMLLDSSYSLAEVRYRENMETKVAEANALYETEKKTAEIARQDLVISKQKNTRNLIVLLSILLLAIIGILAQFYINRQKRLQKESELALLLERERAQNLEELDKAKTDLFNNISHELRTPLTMIMGPLHSATEKIKNVQLKDDVTLALDNSRRLNGLINEILDLSKLDAGKLEVQLNRIALYPFLLRLINSFSSLASSQYIILEHNLEASELQNYKIQTDVNKLETIINNLISNAIKFSESGDIIQVKLDHERLGDSTFLLNIQDQGIGIPEEDLPKIFERYFQAKGTENQGTGIGLALTKQLCELLGGSISVKSKKDEGSTFTVRIPVNVVEYDQAEESGHEESITAIQMTPIQINGLQPSILIVEDDLQMAKYLKTILQDYHCEVAFNGQQALEKLSKRSYDLISSDVMMPGMDGFTFRERVNQNPKISNTPFIMLTARALEEDKLRGLQLGVDDYLTKPFSANELKARVHNLIKNKLTRSSLDEIAEDSDQNQLVDQARRIVMDHLDVPEFKVADLASELHYSPRQLGRNLKKMTGLAPVEFILEIRLQHAYDAIQARTFGTLNQVRSDVGIESASYFSAKFKQRFGLSPSELMNKR